jgi:hypothetical protein
MSIRQKVHFYRGMPPSNRNFSQKSSFSNEFPAGLLNGLLLTFYAVERENKMIRFSKDA